MLSPPQLLLFPWLLSPPCQPYTRQGLQHNESDRRATALEHLIDLLELDGSLLPGVTRDSILQLARDSGRKVEEAQLTIDDVVAWAENGGEAALSGTAAVLAPVGTLLWADGRTVTFNDAEVGDNVLELRQALTALHRGEAEDTHGWLEEVG